MTEGEICREYRLAKDKEKQIDIIADQNYGMDREGVIKILVKHGEMKLSLIHISEPTRP